MRTYVRYLIPLTLLAVIACAPIVYAALRARVPLDASSARGMLRDTIAIGATAWIWQLILAGAAAVMAEGVAAGAPLSQRAALWRGLGGLLRAVRAVPRSGGSNRRRRPRAGGAGARFAGAAVADRREPRRGVPAALNDSIAAARQHLRPTAIVRVRDRRARRREIVLVARFALAVPLPKKPSPLQLIGYPRMLVVAVVALVLVSPLAACALAAIRHHARPR